ncbi:MAG: MFS transporter [Tepidisphaeraceae bacterium]|jgi:MFS family permease
MDYSELGDECLSLAERLDPQSLGAVAELPPPDRGDQSFAKPRRLDRKAVTAALMLVMVLASMEQTVTSTAMPTIIGKLNGLRHYSWVASIYLLACTVSMPLNGRLADALGRKRVILFAIGLFSISSMLAAMSRNMPELIVFRGLQGLGAGGIMPVVLTILGDIFTIEERARIQGLFSAVWGTASLAGPMLGWFLVTTLGWRWVFLVNLPFGFLAAGVLMVCYHDLEKPRSVDLDLPGIIALAAACMAMLTLVSRLGPGGWPWETWFILAAALVVSGIFFLFHERRAENPILPMDVLLHRAIGPSLIGSGLLGIGFLSLDTFVPLYVQGGQGGGAGAAAWVVTPVMLTWALSGIAAAPLVVRRGFRWTARLGSLLVVVGFTGLILCAVTGAPRTVLAIVLAITGFGFGPASMSFLLAAQDAVSWQRRGSVTSSIQFFRTVGGAMGIGILGALFNILTGPAMAKFQSEGLGSGALLDQRQRELLPLATRIGLQQSISHSLRWVFAAMLGVAVIQVVIAGMMPRKKTDHKITPLEAAEVMAG